jgi:hypothetical protein
MAGLLSRIRSYATTEDCIRIGHLLESVSYPRQFPSPVISYNLTILQFEDNTSSFPQESASFFRRGTDIDDCQRSLTAGAVEEHGDRIEERTGLLHDYLHTDDQTRATSIFGGSSEVQWLRMIEVEQSKDIEGLPRICSQLGGSLVPRYEDISSYTFWANSSSIESGLQSDPYELPTSTTAERLLKCYLCKVHDSFPVLPRQSLEDQFRRCFTQCGDKARFSSDWRTILNLVFALGARYYNLARSHGQADELDHILYQSRARVLFEDGTTAALDITVSTISSVRIYGLLAFYSLSVGQMSR